MSFKRFLNSHFVFGIKNHISFLQGSSFRFAVINCLFLLHNSWVPSAQQLMGICTTPDMRAHNSCCAVGDINLSKDRHYIFRQLLLLLWTTYVISFNCSS